MNRPKTLERLLRIREIEEEQNRLQLDAALAKLESLERARDAAAEKERQGRMLVGASVHSAEIADRQAGLMETETARRRVRILALRIASAQKETLDRRRDFVDKRIERRQAETLVERDDNREKLESDRRSQRSVDDWFGARRHRRGDDDQDHR